MSIIVLLPLFGLAMPAEADCPELRAQVEDAYRQQNLVEAMDLAERVVADLQCSEEFRSWLRATMARAILRDVERSTSAGKLLEDFEQKLNDSLRFEEHWMAYALLGDLADQRGDYTEASVQYQQALARIQNMTATPKPPSTEVIEKLFRNAERTRLLSAQYVTVPTTSRGQPTGLGTDQVRGFAVTSVAIPVTFVFGKAEFTDPGRQAAQDLLQQLLKKNNGRSIVLIGHTDPVGSEDHNRELSVARAEAVRNFLHQNGYHGDIHVEGRGENEPYPVPDPGRFSLEELHQLHRRVELRW